MPVTFVRTRSPDLHLRTFGADPGKAQDRGDIDILRKMFDGVSRYATKNTFFFGKSLENREFFLEEICRAY